MRTAGYAGSVAGTTTKKNLVALQRTIFAGTHTFAPTAGDLKPISTAAATPPIAQLLALDPDTQDTDRPAGVCHPSMVGCMLKPMSFLRHPHRRNHIATNPHGEDGQGRTSPWVRCSATTSSRTRLGRRTTHLRKVWWQIHGRMAETRPLPGILNHLQWTLASGRVHKG